MKLEEVFAIVEAMPDDVIKASLPLLLANAPEYREVLGKKFPVRAYLLECFSDGQLDIPDIKKAIKYLRDAKEVPDHIGGPEPTDPAPPEMWPSSLKLNVARVIDPNEDEIPFELHPNSDGGNELQLVLKGGTDNLPIRSRIVLEAQYLDADGDPFAFEDRGALHLYHTSHFFAQSERGRVSIGPGRGAVMNTLGAHVANFREAEYDRTGGMDPVVKFPPEANEQVFHLFFEVKLPSGKVLTSNHIITPKVS